MDSNEKVCIKQQVTCVIVRQDGTRYIATNTCKVTGDECPRIAAGCESGTGYELCGSIHAEVNAAAIAEETKHIPGEAFISGHTYICKDCQDTLRAIGVNTFHIVGAA